VTENTYLAYASRWLCYPSNVSFDHHTYTEKKFAAAARGRGNLKTKKLEEV